MKKSDAYEFVFEGDTDNLYAFATANKLVYEVRFKPSGYLFESDQPFVDSIFEMVLLPVKDDIGKEKRLDKRIPDTVAAIARHFLARKKNVFLYVCEDKDGKGTARDRKFDHWYKLYDSVNYFKFNFIIADGEKQYFNSVIGTADNPYRTEIISACFELTENNSK